MSSLIEILNASKQYGNHDPIIERLDLSVMRGESVAIWGPSGCGKSTLLKIIGLLDTFTHGQYLLNDVSVSTLSRLARAQYRNKFFGFIFQSFFLIPHLTVIDNVMLPLLYRGEERTAAKAKAIAMLDQLSVLQWQNQLPNFLSGGQQQRVSIARALIGEPKLILADEPTGALDPVMAKQVFDLLGSLVAKGISLIMVTHDRTLADQCDRRIDLACCL